MPPLRRFPRSGWSATRGPGKAIAGGAKVSAAPRQSERTSTIGSAWAAALVRRGNGRVSRPRGSNPDQPGGWHFVPTTHGVLVMGLVALAARLIWQLLLFFVFEHGVDMAPPGVLPLRKSVPHFTAAPSWHDCFLVAPLFVLVKFPDLVFCGEPAHLKPPRLVLFLPQAWRVLTQGDFFGMDGHAHRMRTAVMATIPRLSTLVNNLQTHPRSTARGTVHGRHGSASFWKHRDSIERLSNDLLSTGEGKITARGLDVRSGKES